jgi:Ca2+-binding RTX toxin-like protein
MKRIAAIAVAFVAFVPLAFAKPTPIVLTAGDDAYRDNNKWHIILAEGGDDKVWGRGAGDRIYGGRGNDHLRGGMGKDKLYAGPGNDKVVGFGDEGQIDLLDCGPGEQDAASRGARDIVDPSCEFVRNGPALPVTASSA